MPPFTLSRPSSPASSRSSAPASTRPPSVKVGDAARGRALFEGKGDCAACHRVNGRGALTAPDLSGIGLTRTVGRAAAVAGRSHARRWCPIEPARCGSSRRAARPSTGGASTKTPTPCSCSTRVARLRSLAKSDIRTLTYATASSMPSYASRLTADEIADLVGYLASLREPMMPTTRARSLVALSCSASSRAGRGAGDRRSPAARGRRAAELADLLRRRTPASATRLLRQIDPGNAKNLELKWVLPNQTFGAWQATPLVVDGVMYVTQRPNDVLAVDAKTGRVFWQYRYTNSPDARVCCGANNRGLAILGSTLFMGTLDGHLVAIDAAGGPAAVEHRGRRPDARLLDHDGAARGEGQDPRRRRRRRVRHPRLRRRVRSRVRQGVVALLHGARAGRARPRDLDRRRVEDRRRLGVADAVVRSRRSTSPTGASAIPAPIGTRTCGPATTFHRFGGRARRRTPAR